MVYTNVIELAGFPNQILKILLDGTPNPSVNSNASIRFDQVTKRFGGREPYVYDDTNPSELYGTGTDSYFSFPPLTALIWEVGDQTDSYLSLYLAGTGDDHIHIAPTRIFPTISQVSIFNLTVQLKVSDFYAFTTSASIENNFANGVRRDSTIYLNGLPSNSVSALSFSAGDPYIKTEIDTTTFYRFVGPVTSVSGSLNAKINYFSMFVYSSISGDNIVFNVRPSLEDPEILESYPQNNSTTVCGTSAITGTINYSTGDWDLVFNCGSSVSNSYISASIITQESTLVPSISVTGTTPNLTIQSDYPIYLYDMDIAVSNDGITYVYGFSISFEGGYLIENNNTAEVSVYPKMIDSTRQVSSNLSAGSIWRLTDPLNTGTISAIDEFGSEYSLGTWIDGTNAPIKIADADGVFDYYTLNMEISSINGKLEEISLFVATNSANQDLDLSAVPIDGDPFGYNLILESSIPLTEGSYIIYTIEDNYNGSYIQTCEDGIDVPLDTAVLYETASCVNILNVGPGNTTISVSSISLGLSGSYEILSDVELAGYEFKLSAETTGECSLTNSYYITAYFENPDNGSIFTPPEDGTLCWILTSDGDRFVTSTVNRNDDTINISECVPAADNDLLTLNINVNAESIFSASETISIMAIYTDTDGNTLSSEPVDVLADVLPDPLVFGTFFEVYSGDELLFDSYDVENYPLLSGSNSLTFKIKDNYPFNFDSSDIIWTINGVNYSGLTSKDVTLTMGSSSITAALSISGISIAGWGERLFCISDLVTFNSIISNELDFIAFPVNKFSGAIHEIQTLSNYTSSYGNTAYDCGHSETFVVSAEPGYDTYIWNIGNSQLITESNVDEISVLGNDGTVGSPITIYLSAYKDSVGTGYAFTSQSTNIDPLRSDVVFYDYFGYSLSATITNDVFNMNLYDREPFLIDLHFSQLTASPVQIVGGGTATFEISSLNRGLLDPFTIDINNGSEYYFDFFTKNYNDLFHIDSNTFDVFNICVSADLNIRIPKYDDFDVKEFSTNVFCIPVTAFNGPLLSLTVDNNCVQSGEVIVFSNTTPAFGGYAYSNFIFDDGAGNIISGATSATTLTGYYIDPGTYSPRLTATLGSTQVIKQFDSFILVDCGSNCESYNLDVDRTFPDKLKLPHDIHSLMLNPNERLTSLAFNSFVDKAEENFNYLKSKSRAYSLSVPTEVVNEQFHKEIGVGIIDWKIRDKITFAISESGNIIISDISEIDNPTVNSESRITVLKNDNNITEGDVFVKPISIDVNEDGTKYAVIDGATKSIYIFTFDKDTNVQRLLAYWGGAGSKSSRTKFTNPSSVIYGSDDSIYVLDSGARIVKKYNKFFNWVGNIENPEWTDDKVSPISISSDSMDCLYVLCDNKTIHKFGSDGKFVVNFSVDDLGKLYCNKFYYGSLYIVDKNAVVKYTIDGVRINKWTRPTFESDVVGFDQNGSLIYTLTTDYVHTIFDCLSLEKLRDEDLDEFLWDWNSIKIHKDEFIQDSVYNDSFLKINQNLELFRRSIKSRFITYKNPFDMTKIEYSMIDLMEDDFDDTFSTEDLIIGVNEFVSYEVFRRAIEKIYNNMKSILKTLESKPRNYRVGCSNELDYTWKKLTTSDVTQPNTCAFNPISWSELKNYNVTNWNGLSSQNAIESEYESISFDLDQVKNRVPFKIVNCSIDDK